jgi:L-lactate dehydrogenase
MKPFRSDSILLLVSNPVDVLTSLAQELSGLPKSQVMGSGTFLDSVRLRRLLAHKLGVRIRSLLDRSLGLAKLRFRLQQVQ